MRKMRRLRRAWLLFPPPEDLLARIVGSFTISIGSFTFNLGSFGSVELEQLNDMIARLRESADRVTGLLGGKRPA